MFIFTRVHLLNIDKNSYDNNSPLDYSKYEHHDANTEECLAACGHGTVAGARPGQSGPERGQARARPGPDRGQAGARRRQTGDRPRPGGVRPGPDQGQAASDRGQTGARPGAGLSRAGLVHTELGQLRNNTNVSNLWSLYFCSPPPEKTSNKVSSFRMGLHIMTVLETILYLKDWTTRSSGRRLTSARPPAVVPLVSLRLHILQLHGVHLGSAGLWLSVQWHVRVLKDRLWPRPRP